jgi:tryptophanyl-tRNA synthetase
MNIYFGIRSTGNNLHLGHIMSLLNMFNFIEKNKINNIYILLAELHSEISTISEKKIINNSKLLANKILSLYNTYLTFNSLNNNNISKIKFIFQNDNEISNYHISVTYKYLPLLNISRLTKNPIFKNNKNNSLAFLLYPILQSFDVLLYHNEKNFTTVFLANDQKSNINIMKDIYKKLNIKNINFNILENVIYDITCKQKMSKSLNNFINFDDFNGIEEYIIKYKTGNNNYCYLYNNILKFLIKYFNIKHKCIDNNCYNCKQNILKQLKIIINNYNNYTFNNFKTVSKYDIIDNYNLILDKINNLRCNNENC